MFSKNKNETKEQEELNEMRNLEKQNKELYAHLTNKNQDYFFQLNGRLDELAYEKSKKTVVFNQMLKETAGFQEDAITARKMYGTVTEQAEKIMGYNPDNFEGSSALSPTHHLYLDGALLLGGLFSILNGFSAWRSTEINVNLFQLISNFLLGGLVVLILIKYRPETGQNKGMFKYIMVTAVTMLIWVFAIALVEAIPTSTLNPVVSPLLVMGAGLVGLIAKWYFKKELDIRGSIF